jgi:transposase
MVEPMVPRAKHGGRKRTINVREILNGIFYLLWTGCQWQALPKDLPPKSTVWAYFDLWTWDRTPERIHYALYVAVREQAGREASPTTATARDRQGGAKRGAWLDPQGFDAGKKITGRKRHILVDTLGLLLSVAVHFANIHRDRVFIERIYGNGGHQGPKAGKAAAKTGCWTIEIVERSLTAVG